MMAFLRRTIVGGLLTVLVLGSIAYLLWYAVSAIRTGLEQIASVLSIDTRFPALSALATLLLLVASFGLLLQVRPVHNLVEAGMAWLGNRFPFSKLLHGFELELAGLGKSPITPVLAVLGNAEVLAFVMEELADGRCVVFVPASPKPSLGFVYLLPREDVHPIDASHYRVVSCVSDWGVGMKKMLQKPEGARNAVDQIRAR
jgi:uncharacterized membrane protein